MAYWTIYSLSLAFLNCLRASCFLCAIASASFYLKYATALTSLILGTKSVFSIMIASF